MRISPQSLGFAGGKNVIRKIGSARLVNLLSAFRDAYPSARTYNKVRGLWVMGLRNDRSYPQAWEAWRALIGRFNLDDEIPRGTWFQIVESFVGKKFYPPSALEALDHTAQSDTAASKPEWA